MEKWWEICCLFPLGSRLHRFPFDKLKKNLWRRKKKRFTTSQCHPCLLSNDLKLSCSDPSVFFPSITRCHVCHSSLSSYNPKLESLFDRYKSNSCRGEKILFLSYPLHWGIWIRRVISNQNKSGKISQNQHVFNWSGLGHVLTLNASEHWLCIALLLAGVLSEGKKQQ